MPKDDQVQVILQELVRRANEDSRRLRAIEQKLQAMENRVISIEDSSLDKTKKNNQKFAEIEINTRNANDEMLKLKTSMERFARQINSFARRKDVKEIEKMFELLNPIREEFVTKEELESIKVKEA